MKPTYSQVDNLCLCMGCWDKKATKAKKKIFKGVSTTAITPKSNDLKDEPKSDQPAKLIAWS